MNNLALAELFLEIAQLLEIKGDNPFKIRAYRRGAQSIALLTEDVRDLLERGTLRQVDGIGATLEAKIREWLEHGEMDYHRKLLEEVPRGLIEVTRVPGIGPKLAFRLYREIGVQDIEDLRQAVAENRLLDVYGLGPKAQEKIKRALEQVRQDEGRIPIGVARPIALRLLDRVQAASGVVQAELAGSIRRWKESVGDIDLVVAADDPGPVMEQFVTADEVREVQARGATKSSVLLYNGMQADIRVVRPTQFAAALHHFTGSQAHHLRLREWARKKGFRINEYGIEIVETEEVITPASEADLYATLDLPFIPPELREDQGEFELALADRLPRLVAVQDLRGDLHVHSTWSDGTASIEAVARHARDMGWEYVAICDHSKSLRIAGGLDVDELMRQGDEILRVREMVPGVQILRGVEVDIMGDGTLDLPDKILAELDIVVASVHSGFNQDRDRMTQRLCKALDNPFVDIIGHPTGRRIGHRLPYELDFDRVLEAALRSNKALEINASPGRLDLSDELARRAKEAGVFLAINTDAHSLEEMATIQYGLGIARRAGLSKGQVINGFSFEQLEAWRRSRAG